jgi:hypothetical protein
MKTKLKTKTKKKYQTISFFYVKVFKMEEKNNEKNIN